MGEPPQFPFFGAGDATYYEWAEVHVLFARDPSARALKAIAEGVPVPLRDNIKWNGRHLMVASDQFVHLHIAETWPDPKQKKNRPSDTIDEEGNATFVASDGQLDKFNMDIERWLKETHEACPILAAFRDEDVESGGTQPSAWHKWSMKQFRRLWKSLKAFPRNEESREILVAIAAVAARAGLEIPEEFQPPKKVDVQSTTAAQKGISGREAMARLLEAIGFQSEFGPTLERETKEHPDRNYSSMPLFDGVVNAALSRSRRKFLEALGPICRESPDFAASIAYSAYTFLNQRMADALDLFEVLVRTPGLPLSTYNNAVGALSYQGLQPATPEQEQRFIEAARPYGERNPSILANIACVSLLRGRPEEALDQLELSVKHGHDRKLIVKDKVFAPLHAHPRWVALVR